MSTLAETLDVVAAGLPSALINSCALKRLKTGARDLPQILNGGLECRLGSAENEQVDVQLCVVRGTPDVEILQEFVKDQPGDHGPWQRLAALVAVWADRTTAIHDQIAEIWLEFDCKDQISPPSVFLGLKQSPQPADKQIPVVNAAVETLLDEVVWRRSKDTIRRCFEACADGVFISHVGVMLGRDADAVRINVKRLTSDSIADYLSDVGWSGDATKATTLTRHLLDHVDRITLCLDAGAVISNEYGLECIAQSKTIPDQWRALIKDLPMQTEIDEQKTSALLQWNRTLTPDSSLRPWPRKLIAASLFPSVKLRSQLNCQVSHLKVSCSDGEAVKAKAYLAFRHNWIPVEPASKPDISAFYSNDDVALWQKVLGANLHFHFGFFDGEEDLQTGLSQTVRNYFPEITYGASVLDLGCGWGGPAKVLAREHGCHVTGVTISKTQAAHCQNEGVDVRLLDLDDASTKPPKGFDVLLSLEMISHIQDKIGFLQRVRECGHKLILSESCAADDYQGRRVTFGGSMRLCTVNELLEAVEAAGWTIKRCHDRRPQSMRTISLWKKNLERTFGDMRPPGAFAPLHDLIENALSDPAGWAKSFPLIDIVAD